MPLHTCKIFILSRAEPQHILNYLLLLFSILEFCYHRLYCDPENTFLLIRYCQNHSRIIYYKVKEKQKWLAMPDTNIVIFHHTMLQTNSSFFSIPLFISGFSGKKHLISFLAAKVLLILLGKVIF